MIEAIWGGTILAGADLRVLNPGFVIIDGPRIAEVGSGSVPLGIGRTRNARGGLITPAFINAHTHVGDAFLKDAGFGRSFSELLDPPDGLRFRGFREVNPAVISRAIRGAVEHMVSCGTLTFADFRESGLAGVRLLREAVASARIRAVTLGRFGDFPPQPLSALDRNEGGLGAHEVLEAESILREADGFSLVTVNDLTDEALRQVHQLVRAREKLLGVHVAQVPSDRATSLRRTGRGDVDRVIEELVPDFVVHLTDATERELDRIAAAQIPVVVCPRGQGALGHGLPRFDRMIERGIPVALGTDNVMLGAPDLLRELDYSSRVIRAVRRDTARPTAREMLQMVTINAARAIGRAADLGSIEPGKVADLIIFDLDSDNLRGAADPIAALVCRAESRDIMAVMFEGCVVRGALSDAG